MTIPWLTDDPRLFPPVTTALTEPDGLLAVGGDLSPERLLNAYCHGVFPWFNDDDPILWWSPDPRAVLIPGDIHGSKSLKKFIRKTAPKVSFDQCFDRVIGHCRGLREHCEGTWITDGMEQAYNALHQMGCAHSVEVWLDGELIGGLYGISIGKVFFGESMFSLAPNGSKIAALALAQRLNDEGFALIDCQVESEHILSLGAKIIPRADFIQQITAAITISSQMHWPQLASVFEFK